MNPIRDTALARLATHTAAITALEAQIVADVRIAREARATWREIGDALGTTASNAHRKYKTATE